MQRFTSITTAGVVALLLSGCASQPPASAPSPPSATDPAAETTAPTEPPDALRPVGLIGLWRVEGVNEEPGAILRLDVRDVSLWRECGTVWGDWRADHSGLFVAYMYAWSGACGDADEAVPAWLHEVAGFRVDGEVTLLIDATGATVARLLHGERPEVPDTVSEQEAERPRVTAETRAALKPAAALPQDLTPAGEDELSGRWVPVRHAAGPDPAFVEFNTDGTWQGSDGCNAQGGRWAAGPDGALLATTGGSTLIGCNNIDIGSWLADAARAGLDGDELALLDTDGDVTGQLRRDTS